MDYKNMSDSELANVMVNYINRIVHLERLISNYMNGLDDRNIPAEKIKKEYAQLKTEIREDANYLNLVRNQDDRPTYMGAFSPSIREAAAFGFRVPINHRVDREMFNAVAEAHYKLTKYKDLEEWGALM